MKIESYTIIINKNSKIMKKVLLLLIALTLGFGLKAQCPHTTAIDFTATDVHGTEVHLFDILDGGQYVLIDFFFTTCGPCQQACPKIVQAYSALGCNMHDVYFMEIDTGDSEATCLNWVSNYGVEYPTIAGATGGSAICNQYGIEYYPTVILIAPDRSIVIQDLYPIGSAQVVINALAPYGIEEHECTPPTPKPEVTITVDQVLETEATVTFTPDELCAMYYYTIATDEEMQQWTTAAGLELPAYLQCCGFPASMGISHTFTELIPNTDYTIYAVGEDAEGNLGDVVQETVTTTGGGSEVLPDFTGTDLEGNALNLYSILDGGQAVLINFFLSGDELSENAMRDVVEAFHSYGCNEHDVFFMEISPNGDNEACQNWVEQFEVQYPTISRDGGGNDIAQAIPVAFYPTIMVIRPDHTIAMRDVYPPTLEQIAAVLDAEGYTQFHCLTNVDENDHATTLFPNPANESLTLKGENLGTASVYNALGQKMEEFRMESSELTINTANYPNGVYFIKNDGKTLRFVVNH